MFKLSICVLDIPIKIISNSSAVIQYFKKNFFTNHLLPAYTIMENISIKCLKLYIFNHCKISKIITGIDNIIVFYKDIEVNIRHLSYLLLYSIQIPLQKKSNYYIHSASFVFNNKGYLIIGESNSGKTSLALNAEKKFNAKLVGDDGTIININKQGKGTIVAGNRLITYHQKYDQRFTYDLDLKKYTANNINKVYSKAELKFIIFIIPHCICKTKYNMLHDIRDFYEKITMDITGIGYFYLPEFLLYPNQDNKRLANKRLQNVKKLFNEVKIYNISGTYEYINNSVFTIMENAL